jgi:hypothetical protein
MENEGCLAETATDIATLAFAILCTDGRRGALRAPPAATPGHRHGGNAAACRRHRHRHTGPCRRHSRAELVWRMDWRRGGDRTGRSRHRPQPAARNRSGDERCRRPTPLAGSGSPRFQRASRSYLGAHPRAIPRLITLSASASCWRRCLQSSSSERIAALALSSCQASTASTSQA